MFVMMRQFSDEEVVHSVSGSVETDVEEVSMLDEDSCRIRTSGNPSYLGSALISQKYCPILFSL